MLNRTPIARVRWLCALAVCALALPLGAAVPGQVDFQGLLLDSGGQKVNGAVDLIFTLYDAPAGGIALWTETHPDVQVTDGVYGVTLGTTTPLTPALLGTGNVHLQIAVDGETLTPRRQLLAVPYAVRAQTAENAENVGGVSGGFYTEIVQNFPFDGGNPPNDDPSEGTGDVDGDGLQNFVDPDNDADGLSDTAELAQASNINLVTPVISGFSPTSVFGNVPQTITVLGSNFEPGITVSFGIDAPTPTGLTATSFTVSIGPQPDSIANVTVTRLNGQSDTAQYAFRARRVFLADTTTGNIGGIAGADASCAARAAQLGLTGTFRAWISDATTSPSTRFLQDQVAYARLDGTRIADNWADLTDGTLDAPIVPVVTTSVWTGTEFDGEGVSGTCNNWTSNNGSVVGRRGVASQTNSQWSATATDLPCSFAHALYCFEQ
jgi:hypothetical protein